jgi:hypothetical protein
MIELIIGVAMLRAAIKAVSRSRPRAGQVLLAGVVLVSLLVSASAQTPVAKAVGTVKSTTSTSVVLTTDSGSDLTVTFADSARIVRAAPGQTDLKSAPPIAVSDIQIGDRVFARGQAGEGNAVIASSAIVMKKSDIANRQQRERDEWRKGVGGIVKEVNAAGNSVTIANAMIASGKPIIIHISPETIIRRYAPDSVKFDDAKSGTLDQIKPGDQLRARGSKNGEEAEFTAQAIVSGTFRDIAGTVVSTDAANNNVTVMDLLTKKPVVVKVSAESQLRRLPPFVAQMIAMRLKGGAPGADAGPNAMGAGEQGPPQAGFGNRGAGQGGHGKWQGEGKGTAGAGSGMQGGPGGNWRGGGGPPDFQQMLGRMPAVATSDLQKGDAVMLVATEGSSASGPTAITLLAGVEPILTAAPSGARASTFLSPWNLAAPAGAGGDASTQ